jgi:Methyltransferase domain
MSAFADWLALREPADAAARATDLVDRLRLPAPLLVHDLGSGTGSMVRWLAPRLPGPQHWVLHDRDPALLDRALADLPPGVTAEARVGDLTRLTAADLAGAGLVTASALLDMLTPAEIDRVVNACAGPPALLTLTVVGAVALDPPDPLDAVVAAAFDAHQRRTVTGRSGRTLAGPDAAAVAVAAYERRGVVVETRDTPWRLGSGDLLRAWFDGWIEAATDQQPGLSAQLNRYVADRQEQCDQGRLRASVGHRDLLARGND